MTEHELKALRKLLFYSIPEAAVLVSASTARPDGVSERAWRKWESGQVPVPEDVSNSIKALVRYREDVVRKLTGKQEIRWFDSLEEWRQTGQADVLFCPYQSAVAQVLSGDGCTLVYKR